MGTANSKHRSGDLSKNGNPALTEISSEDKLSFRDMEGPSFYCAYLGFTPLAKPPTNLSVLQSPIKELYFNYRKTPASGRSANLKIIQNGILVVLYENGSVKAELFFDFSSVTFVEAAKFLPVKTSSERKPKAMFVPVDESKGAVSDKNAFLVEKNFHFLISSTHPPLVICVVRRPTGVKALDCHAFALDTIENSLHISALIASAQSPSGQINKVDTGGDLARGKPGFDRGARGDVIRTDHGEYSVYRGPQGGYDTPPPQRYSGGPVTETQPGQWYSGGPVQSPGRNGYMGPPQGGAPGSIMLTQDNFREQPSPIQPYGVAPGQKGYGMYEQQQFGGPPGGGYMRQPDVIMHTRERSGDSGEYPQDRSFSGPDGGVRMRYDEVNMRNNANSRLSSGPMNEGRLSGGQVSAANRLSAGQVPPSGKLSPRPNELTSPGYLAGPQYSQWQSDPMTSPGSPLTHMNSPRSPPVMSPNSPRGFDQRDGGPVFSASNLESRNPGPEPEADDNSGRPVARVPPHMIGVKVLPTDFRAVKLKPKTDKRPESSENLGYDSSKELAGKYKEIYEHSSAKTNHYSDNDGFSDFGANKGRNEEHSKEFLSHWNDTVKDHRTGSGGSNPRYDDSPNVMYRQGGGPRDYSPRYEDNNNKNRFSSPVYAEDNNPSRNRGQRSQSSYETGGMARVNDDPHARTKDMEIANMFSNFKIQGGNSRDMYRQPRDRNEIEDGLGYLP